MAVAVVAVAVEGFARRNEPGVLGGGAVVARETGQCFPGLAHTRPVPRIGAEQVQHEIGSGPGVLRFAHLAVGRRVENFEWIAGAEGRFALQGVEKRGAESEHIRGGRRIGAARHLRRQIRGRTADQAGFGEGDIAGGPGDTEIGDLDGAVIVEQYVARFHVAVHDARLMRRDERRGHLFTDPRHLRQW